MFNEVADDVRGGDVNLLNQWRFLRWRKKTYVAKVLHRAALSAGESHRGDAEIARGAQRRNDVGRSSRRGNREQPISPLAEPTDLAFEHVLEPVIVADRGEYRRIRAQRNRRQRRSIEIQPRQKFSGDVLRVPGAPAVSR